MSYGVVTLDSTTVRPVAGSIRRKGVPTAKGWQVLHTSAAIGPAGRAQAGGHLAGLDFELG